MRKILKIKPMGKFNILQVRYDDGFIATFTPDADVSGQNKQIIDEVKKYHTVKVKTAYENNKQKLADEFAPNPEDQLKDEARSFLHATNYKITNAAEKLLANEPELAVLLAKREEAREVLR